MIATVAGFSPMAASQAWKAIRALATSEVHRNRIAAAIYANCEHLDNAHLDEIIAWVQLYKSK